MKFPSSALVIATTQEEVLELRDFLIEAQHEPTLRKWGGHLPSYYDVSYRDHTDKTSCYNIEIYDIGWCSPEWYKTVRLYENKNHDWNYISVSKFIAKVMELNGVKPLTVDAMSIL